MIPYRAAPAKDRHRQNDGLPAAPVRTAPSALTQRNSGSTAPRVRVPAKTAGCPSKKSCKDALRSGLRTRPVLPQPTPARRHAVSGSADRSRAGQPAPHGRVRSADACRAGSRRSAARGIPPVPVVCCPPWCKGGWAYRPSVSRRTVRWPAACTLKVGAPASHSVKHRVSCPRSRNTVNADTDRSFARLSALLHALNPALECTRQ